MARQPADVRAAQRRVNVDGCLGKVASLVLLAQFRVLNGLEPQEFGLVMAIAELTCQVQCVAGGGERFAEIVPGCQDRPEACQDEFFLEAIAGFPGISQDLGQELLSPNRLTRGQQCRRQFAQRVVLP